MLIGIPKEIKNNENRVGCTPAGVMDFVKNGHEVIVEAGAGIGSGFTDQEYIDAGAKMVSHEEAWGAKMVIKVKEPQPSEYQYFRDDMILYTYLHLAAEADLTKALVDAGTLGIAYETVQIGRSTPLLRPMSEVAGRRSVIIGATQLEKHRGGSGILLGGTPGTESGVVTVVGGGIAGTNAALYAAGLGAKVNILELNEDRIRQLTETMPANVFVYKSNTANLAVCTAEADLLVSTILLPGEKAPKIITEEMVKSMKPGSVIVDISIDQGGSVETIDRITTHDEPVFEKHGVIHYSVANMPGATPRTSTMALTNATIPYAVQIANNGFEAATKRFPELVGGVNTQEGNVTHSGVAVALGYDCKEVKC